MLGVSLGVWVGERNKNGGRKADEFVTFWR